MVILTYRCTGNDREQQYTCIREHGLQDGQPWVSYGLYPTLKFSSNFLSTVPHLPPRLSEVASSHIFSFHIHLKNGKRLDFYTHQLRPVTSVKSLILLNLLKTSTICSTLTLTYSPAVTTLSSSSISYAIAM